MGPMPLMFSVQQSNLRFFAELLLTPPRPRPQGQHLAGAHSRGGESSLCSPWAASDQSKMQWVQLWAGAALLQPLPGPLAPGPCHAAQMPGSPLQPLCSEQQVWGSQWHPSAHWRVLSAKACAVDASKQPLVQQLVRKK